jgi:hypothetical protein
MNFRNLIFGFLLLLPATLLLSSCEKLGLKKDNYYIKYQVESSTIYYGGKLNVELNTENGKSPFVVNQRENWETTIGPVKKGFTASLKATKEGWNGQTVENHLKLKLRILVSKNNGPFALKKSDEPSMSRATAELQYVIE